MSEEFGVDGALGDSAAVDGDIFLMFSRPGGVNDPWEELLAGSGLAGDEHGEVDMSDLQRPLYGAEQSWGIAYYREALLGCEHLGRNLVVVFHSAKIMNLFWISDYIC